jgi:small-conductance mechanosensitive channel
MLATMKYVAKTEAQKHKKSITMLQELVSAQKSDLDRLRADVNRIEKRSTAVQTDDSVSSGRRASRHH